MAAQQKQDGGTSQKQDDGPSEHASRSHRISKEDLYVLLALFMEDFPLETEEGEPAEQGEDKKYRKVGAALVLPNDKIFAIDCTRNGVHGVARLLMEHQDVVEDSKIFVSRKPCYLCTKLLVQSKVKEIFYLPMEPEYHGDQKLTVDELFRVSAISQKVFVPGAGLKEVVKNKQEYDIPTEQQQDKDALLTKYWNDDWFKNVKDNLPWPSFDTEMKKQIKDDFDSIMAWAAKIALIAGSTEIACKFERYDPKQKEKTTDSKQTVKGDESETFDRNQEQESKQAVGRDKGDETEPFDPENNETDRKQAAVFVTLTRFLAERTDDPKTGVGAVIVDKNRKVVGLGWNGFPTKAVYGQFPRASDKNKSVPVKKYPYIIHAEQNALLMRNTKSITGGILFVTKIPCHECTPLLEMQGIKTVVLGTKRENNKLENEAKTVVSENKPPESLDYKNFKQKMEKGIFNCFKMKSISGEGNDKPSTS